MGLAMASGTREYVSMSMRQASKRLVRAERLRRDVEAYRRTPQTREERALAGLAEDRGLDDDVDWEALYAAAE
jgi:hypothetical protein